MNLRATDIIEAGVKTVEGMVRTVKFCLEAKLGIKIETTDPVFYWLVEHCADLVTKFSIGRDGMTPYERLKHKAYKGEMYEFGSLVLHAVPGKPQGGVMERRWLDGVYLGIRFESPEHIIAMMADGRIVKARDIQQLPLERQWNADRVKGITGKPWAPLGTVRRGGREDQEPRRGEEVDGQDPAPSANRGMSVQQKHLDRFGYSSGCIKCRMMQTNDTSRPCQGHGDACKARIREAAMRDAEFSAQARQWAARTGEEEQQPPASSAEQPE